MDRFLKYVSALIFMFTFKNDKGSIGPFSSFILTSPASVSSTLSQKDLCDHNCSSGEECCG